METSAVPDSIENHTNVTPVELKKVFLETKCPGEIPCPDLAPRTGAFPSPIFVTKSLSGIVCPHNYYDTVYPGIILGNFHLAMDLSDLKRNGVTHILNAAQGKKFCQVDTDADFYAESGIKFLGIAAMDIPGFSLKDHFQEASEFIHEAIEQSGVVYVHCHQGLSRSTSLVIAYLMMKKGMTVLEAAKTVRSKRPVLPNDGFQKQLCKLNEELFSKSVHSL